MRMYVCKVEPNRQLGTTSLCFGFSADFDLDIQSIILLLLN